MLYTYYTYTRLPLKLRMIGKIPEYPKSRKFVTKSFSFFQEAREWSKNHPRVCGFYHTKSQAESSYGELNQAELFRGENYTLNSAKFHARPIGSP